jgi:hypothetical protein
MKMPSPSLNADVPPARSIPLGEVHVMQTSAHLL